MGQREPVSRNVAGTPGQSSDSSLAVGEIYRVVYFSVSLVGPLGAGGERDIADILDVSQRYNQRYGITGALTFNEEHFAQVLEGRRADVGDLFASIRRDRRHTNVLVIEEGWIAERGFSRWAMAYVGDTRAPKVISRNLELSDIIAANNVPRAMALIEMMKFFLLS